MKKGGRGLNYLLSFIYLMTTLTDNIFSGSDSIPGWITFLFNLPSLRFLKQIWEFLQNLINPLTGKGLYEVLEYESTLELKDRHGKLAIFKKHQKVRYLQDNIIAYQDQAWGDGKTLVDYRCTPGFPADRYRSGYKTIILISLRGVKNRGDVNDFNIARKIHQGFLEKSSSWATEISHRTKHISVQLIFPKNRPPLSASVLERNYQKSYPLDDHLKMQLPDGRWSITWIIDQPRQFEQYILRWDW